MPLSLFFYSLQAAANEFIFSALNETVLNEFKVTLP